MFCLHVHLLVLMLPPPKDYSIFFNYSVLLSILLSTKPCLVCMGIFLLVLLSTCYISEDRCWLTPS